MMEDDDGWKIEIRGGSINMKDEEWMRGRRRRKDERGIGENR